MELVRKLSVCLEQALAKNDAVKCWKVIDALWRIDWQHAKQLSELLGAAVKDKFPRPSSYASKDMGESQGQTEAKVGGKQGDNAAKCDAAVSELSEGIELGI